MRFEDWEVEGQGDEERQRRTKVGRRAMERVLGSRYWGIGSWVMV